MWLKEVVVEALVFVGGHHDMYDVHVRVCTRVMLQRFGRFLSGQ